MPTPTNHPASGARRTRRLPTSFALLLVAVVLASSACGTSGTGAVAPPTPTNTPLPTGTPMPIPTSTPAPEWVTYTVLGDARIDIPGVLQLDRSSAPIGHDIVGWHDGQYPLQSDHPVAAEVIITLDAAVVTDETFPCRSGTRITVGPGITGDQSDNTTLITAAHCFPPPPPQQVRPSS